MDDEVEYVGLDDEDPIEDELSDLSNFELDDVEYAGLEDELAVDDACSEPMVILLRRLFGNME